jgi:hypothetical protein
MRYWLVDYLNQVWVSFKIQAKTKAIAFVLAFPFMEINEFGFSGL